MDARVGWGLAMFVTLLMLAMWELETAPALRGRVPGGDAHMARPAAGAPVPDGAVIAIGGTRP